MSTAEATLGPLTRAERPPLAQRSVGTGPTVVWIHGYTMDSRMWEGIWPLLPGYRHVGVDLPGHGDSWSMTPQTSLREMAAAVADVMAREDADTMVALSMGTMVAFELAIARLHPLRRLAVIAPALVGMPAAAGTAERYRLLTRLKRAGIGGAGLADLWMSAPPGIFEGLGAHPGAFAALKAIVRDHSWSELAFGGPAAFYSQPQSLAGLPGSAQELMVIAGDQDMPEFQELGQQLGAGIPGAVVHTLEGAGHLPLLEVPEQTVPLLAAFLSRP